MRTPRNLNRLDDQELDELERYVDRLLRWERHDRAIAKLEKLLHIPVSLAFLDMFVVAIYLALIDPPLQHILELVAIFGASLCTLIITYTIGNLITAWLFPGRFQRDGMP